MPNEPLDDRTSLALLARQVIRNADSILVEDNPTGPAPFRLVVRKGEHTAVQPFTGANLWLACDMCAKRLGLGTKP